jgi:hypothetical protein
MMSTLIATLAWAVTLYISTEEQWRAQRSLQPRSRPMLRRGL